MKIKVCGMKYRDNISQLISLPINYIGFIFYTRSPRYIGDIDLPDIPGPIRKVGVFVNEDTGTMLELADRYGLDVIQLHGNESPSCCRLLKDKGLEVIKAFSISGPGDFEQTGDYMLVCDYFLFDTKTGQYGGSGKKFEWKILQMYQSPVPFFLSGGIGPGDEKEIASLNHDKLYAIDLNSRFELSPALKNISSLKQFIEKI